MPLSQDKTYFTDTAITKSYDGDVNNNLKISSLLRYMQQVGVEHLKAICAEGLLSYPDTSAFLLSKIDVRFSRVPKAGERLTVFTTPQPNVKAQFMRYYEVWDEQGARLAEGMTSWMLFDLKERRILRPTAHPFMFELRERGSISGSDMDKLRIRVPGGDCVSLKREVRYSDIDLNGHMNNSIYADILCDSIPMDVMSTREPERLLIHFANEAHAGETIDLSVAVGQENDYYVTGIKPGGKLCFEAMLSFKKD